MHLFCLLVCCFTISATTDFYTPFPTRTLFRSSLAPVHEALPVAADRRTTSPSTRNRLRWRLPSTAQPADRHHDRCPAHTGGQCTYQRCPASVHRVPS